MSSSQSPGVPSASSAIPRASSDASSGAFGLSAKQLHEVALRSFRVGNRGKLSLCESLRMFSETRLYFDLGFPDIAAYADTFFQLGRSEAYEHVRVATALLELGELCDAFLAGKLGWTVLKAVTRVASVDSQSTWIEFAGRHGGERTLAEARDARLRGRDAPRDASFGLPNLDQKLVLRFSRSDMEKVRAWLDDACAAVAEKTGAEGISIEQALLFLCERSASHAAGGSGRSRLVYQRCPDCRRGRMGTREGFVEVGSEEIERHEGCAEAVVIDGPTPPAMRRKILAREGGRCANPRCGHRADHCHHIRFRSEGGETTMANQVAVCTTCHALVHAGLLRVTGTAEDPCWTPVSVRDRLRGDPASDRADAEHDGGVPTDLMIPSSEHVARVRVSTKIQSANADSPAHPDLEDLARGLVRLGVPVTRSRQLVASAMQGIPASERTEANVLRRALAAC
jgi:hypothetical protein